LEPIKYTLDARKRLPGALNECKEAMEMKILTYVLHGTWYSQDADGVEVLGVSLDIEPLLRKLDEIADSKAEDFMKMCGYIQEERDERYYEAVNASGKYAKFYITEHWLELSENMMGEISREMEKIDRTMDVEQYLHDLYDGGNIPAWQYEYMTRKPEVMQEILQLFDSTEDCNTPFNTTMDIVVGNVMKEITLDDEKLEYLWEAFGDFPGVDEEDCLLDDFLGFETGTHREAVWHWFDERYSGGVAKLMFGGE